MCQALRGSMLSVDEFDGAQNALHVHAEFAKILEIGEMHACQEFTERTQVWLSTREDCRRNFEVLAIFFHEIFNADFDFFVACPDELKTETRNMLGICGGLTHALDDRADTNGGFRGRELKEHLATRLSGEQIETGNENSTCGNIDGIAAVNFFLGSKDEFGPKRNSIRAAVLDHSKFEASSAKGERSPFTRVIVPAMSSPFILSTTCARPFEAAST